MIGMRNSGMTWMMILGKKINIMKLIKHLLFGKPAEPVCHIEEGYYTVYPDTPITEQEWKNEFKVGMLSDRKIVHLD